MLGLAACSNKNAEKADTVAADTMVEVAVEQDTLVDTANPADTTVVTEAAAAEDVTPAQN